MDKIYFIGDSYVTYNDNWVKELASRCGCKVASLGKGGSSVHHLLFQIMDIIPKVKSSDRVVISISSVFRWRFNNFHYNHNYTLDYLRDRVPLEVANSFVNWFKYLQNDTETIYYGSAILSNILNVLVPRLETSLVSYFFTVENDYYFDAGTGIIKREYEPLPMLRLQYDYLNSLYPLKEDEYPHEKFLPLLDGPNHWIDTPEFKNEFWNVYDPIFNHLYVKN